MLNPIAFSTLGCPGWDLDRILSAAKEYGYDAVELRGYLESMDLPLAEPFTPERRAETRKRFEDAGIALCCVSSSGVVTKGNLDHVRSHAELAAALGCPIVRIFGGGPLRAIHSAAGLFAVTDAVLARPLESRVSRRCRRIPSAVAWLGNARTPGAS